MTSPAGATGHDPAGVPSFGVTVDVVALTVRDDDLQALLITRAGEPFAGRLALPGGFVQADEELAGTAIRELSDKTGLRRTPAHLEQLKTYGSPRRDPRRRVASVAYLAMVPNPPEPRPGGDAAAAAWVAVGPALETELAFDHATILADAVERARGKLEYTSLATAFCGPEFTVSQLRHVYEVVWGTHLDPRNFHRKVTSVEGFLLETGHTMIDGPGRPAALFRRGRSTTLVPPLTRES
ncbi:MAG: NUDIX hydrolase [Cellulomonas sp.]